MASGQAAGRLGPSKTNSKWGTLAAPTHTHGLHWHNARYA